MSVPGTKGDRGSWKNEWMVTPAALMAATPVGATTTMRFMLCSFSALRNVVLPVPAFPVRKILFPVCSTKSHASRISLFCSMPFSLFFFSFRLPIVQSYAFFSYFCKSK
ncbi:hypothetical protein HMPREF0649_00100 [Segatella buccae D17]|nr:hypothetical protein HMPREF0649_00100 [Segatella buccae D17]